MRHLPDLHDDGLIAPIVGDWADDKYRLFWCYAEIFATAMKSKWDHRVYVDLFAGPGRARIRGTKRIVPAPPLLALDVPYPFTKYVFSEFDPQKLAALRKRVHTMCPDVDAAYVEGDTNANVEKIIQHIPIARRSSSVLTFCFADPYRLADLQFETIKRLANARFTDFLVLVPSGMDASRNQKIYLKSSSSPLDKFLGDPKWRDSWPTAEKQGQRFADFVVNEFGGAMSKLRYRYEGLGSAQLMSSTSRRLPIYHLLMLSRNPLGGDFWEKCRESSRPQRTLF